jgi:flagellar hook-length control protein FliK
MLGGTPATDEKPAKFAVAPIIAAAVESVQPKNISSDALANGMPTPGTGAPGNASNVPIHRDAPLSLPTPVRDQNWAADFSQKIVWLATNDRQSAQLTLNPPQMGPIEISVNIDKGGATASFMSANAEVRDAIETAMPRLREMFASAGIELGQTNVSAESFRQQSGNQEDNRSTAQWKADNAILVGANGARAASGLGIQRGNGLVDLFA